jgi:hydroxymethylbilane synthase
MKPFLIGTRGSPLALAQTNQVRQTLETAWPGMEFALKIIRTRGDDLSASGASKLPPQPGNKGLFTAELEAALMAEEIDLAVHSLKDLPTEAEDHPDLALGAIPKRADARDVLISRSNEVRLNQPGAIIATGSPRRAAQLKLHHPNWQVVPVRGNIDTRLRKLRDNEAWSGLILAAAGLGRLSPSLDGLEAHPLPFTEMLPAPGQGALGLQIKRGRSAIQQRLAPIHHADTSAEVTAERAFLRGLGGGCQQPIAALGRVSGKQLVLEGVAWLEKSAVRRVSIEGWASEAAQLGAALAKQAKHGY